jgi:hypothetical protein
MIGVTDLEEIVILGLVLSNALHFGLQGSSSLEVNVKAVL